MIKKKKNIMGLKFRCDDCNQVFAIGKNGVDACLGRVRKHMQDTKHMSIPPINPPKGLTYKTENGDVKVVYDGKDKEAFFKEVKAACIEHRTNMIPMFKLS